MSVRTFNIGKLYFDSHFLTSIFYLLTWLSLSHWFFQRKR